jgi:hypothetical protein
MSKLSKEELNQQYGYYLTVGDLKKFLAESNLPDDAKILSQRVEDIYFEKHGWKTYNKKNFHFPDEEIYDNQYIPVFSCLQYKDEEDLLFLNLHY